MLSTQQFGNINILNSLCEILIRDRESESFPFKCYFFFISPKLPLAIFPSLVLLFSPYSFHPFLSFFDSGIYREDINIRSSPNSEE